MNGKRFKRLARAGLYGLALVTTLSACALDTVRWREEVLLHDGQKVVVERSQTRGGRHEIGQEVPINQHTISFVPPGARTAITWKTTFGDDINDQQLILVALDVIDGMPYIATQAAGCIAYNKWGRPNPPYIFFQFDASNWKRIPLEQFPKEIKEVNVVMSVQQHEKELQAYVQPVPAANIAKINWSSVTPEMQFLKTIHRTPIKTPQTTDCAKLVYDGNGGWLGMDWFTDQPTYDACMKFCTSRKIKGQYCLCDQLFKKLNQQP